MKSVSRQNPLAMPSFPAYPTTGGRIEKAPKKVGPWIFQPKVEDWHAVLHPATGQVWNQYGKPSSITGKFVAALAILKRCPFEWLDVGLMNNRHPLMRGCIIVFDLMVPDMLFWQRRAKLEEFFETLPLASELLNCGGGRTPKVCYDRVFLINQIAANTRFEAVSLSRVLETQNAIVGRKFYEGLVAKRTDKPYPMQLRKAKEPTPWMMKHRFDQES